MKIPLIKPDLPPFEIVEDKFREIIQNGRITNFGKYVNAFEQEAGAYLNTNVATLSSGTAGLILTLQALGLKPGQKVVLPSFTFMATAQAVLYAGGLPIFADIGDDLTLSLDDLEVLLARHRDVAMVLPVHTYGLPCQVEIIQALADAAAERNSQSVSVVYDAAHAFGSAIGKRTVGSFGDAEVFSLSVTKVLVSVEGGMVSSRNSELIQRLRKMRNYGIEENYDAHWPGLNAKMSEFHAIIGLYNLRRLDALLEERTRKAGYYLEQLRTHTNFKTLPLPKGITHTFKDFTVLVPEEAVDKREVMMDFLKERGIETRAYFFPPVHQQGMFRRFADRPLPNTEKFSRRVITLPFYTSITEEEIDYIVKALKEA